MKELFSEENRKKTIGVICGSVAVIVIVVLLVIFNPFVSKDKKIEKNLDKRMRELTKSFYENYYFDQVGSDFVKSHAENGIKIDLANLARINNNDSEAILNEFKNSKGESCNTTSTKATIMPKDPYGKTDYELKIEIDCGFNK